MAVALSRRLQALIGRPLAPTTALRLGSVAALAQHLEQMLDLDGGGGARIDRTGPAEQARVDEEDAALAARIEQLSDVEAEQALLETLARMDDR